MDAHLRGLARRVAADSDDLDARVELLRGRVRTGELSEERLAFAAFLGDQASRLALGSSAPEVPENFEEWTGQFCQRYGPETDARAWLAEARSLCAGFDADPRPREAILAAEALLLEPTKENARRTARAAYALALGYGGGPGGDHTATMAAWDQRAGQAEWAAWEPREGLRAYSYRGACEACSKAVDALARWQGGRDLDRARRAIVADLVPWVLGREVPDTAIHVCGPVEIRTDGP